MPSNHPSITEHVKRLESQDSQALVAVFDAFGYYHYASPNHYEAIGYTVEELLNIHLSHIVDEPVHHAAYVLRTIAVIYARPIPFTSRLIAKNGQRVHVSGTLQHFREAGGARYFLTCVHAGPEDSS